MGTKPTTIAYLGERLAGLIWGNNCNRGVWDNPTWRWGSGRRQLGGPVSRGRRTLTSLLHYQDLHYYMEWISQAITEV